MAKQKHTTNPTRIVDIPKANIKLKIDRNARQEIDRLSLEQLDLSDLKLPSDARVSVIGKARDTELVFDGGTVGAKKAIVNESLDSIDKRHPFHVRVIVFGDTDKRILASCERLGVYETEEGALQSLLPVEPADLGETLWKLSAPEGERPVLQVSVDEKARMMERIRHDALFQALILPEAIRQAVAHLLKNRSDDDDPDTWQARWSRFLESLSIEFPSDEQESEEDSTAIADWIESTTATVGQHLRFKTKMLAETLGGEE